MRNSVRCKHILSKKYIETLLVESKHYISRR